jgi:branched-chain amino acid transport system substrate-binding protein
VLDAVTKAPYQTVLGPIRFNANHELAENPYRLLEWQNGRFVTAPAVSGSQ